MCNKTSEFTPNFMVRDLLKHPKFTDEISILARQQVLPTVQERLKDRYPDFKIEVNNFPPRETDVLLEWIEKSGGRKLSLSLKELGEKYNNESLGVFIARSASASPYFFPGALLLYKLIVVIDDNVYLLVSNKKHWVGQ